MQRLEQVHELRPARNVRKIHISVGDSSIYMASGSSKLIYLKEF